MKSGLSFSVPSISDLAASYRAAVGAKDMRLAGVAEAAMIRMAVAEAAIAEAAVLRTFVGEAVARR